MNRRKFLQTTGAAAATGAISSIGSMVSNAFAQSGPIRIGLMAPLTGVVAAGGKELVEGFNLYWDQVGRKVAGRDIEVMIEDDGANPDTTLQKARRLVEQRNVHWLVGNILANTGLAVAEYVKGNGVPYFIPVIAADDLTQRKRLNNVVRIAGYTSSQTPRPIADYGLKQGYKKAVTISQDYAFGHEQCGGFCQTFTEGSGQILGQLWNPLNTADFSPYIAQIQNLKPDVVFAMETGADASRFIRQWANFGLKDKIPVLYCQNATDQSVIRTMGPEAEGLISGAHFCEGRDDPANNKFLADYDKAYQKLPSIYGFSHYSGAMWLAEAIKRTGGKVEDKANFLNVVRQIKLTGSPLGKTVQLDAYGNPVYDVYIRKTAKRADGKLWNVPVMVYPDVGQFWKYNPETYMQQPPYSRTFQGIKKI